MDRSSKRNGVMAVIFVVAVFGGAYVLMRPTPNPGINWDASRSNQQQDMEPMEETPAAAAPPPPPPPPPPPCPACVASPQSDPATFCKGCAEWRSKLRQWETLRDHRNALFDKADPAMKKHSTDWLFDTQWKCETGIKRVGRSGDGGKNMCMDTFPKGDEPCLVYSVGSRGDYSFEAAIHALNPKCEIHIFDPTWQPGPNDVVAMKNIGATYHTTGFGHQHMTVQGWLGPVERFATIIKDLKHTDRKINVFKIDCEGCEWRTFLLDIFPSMMTGDVNFDQMLIELHLTGENFYNLIAYFHMADALGLKLFATEFNQWSAPEDYCSEFSFVMNKGPENCAHPVCKAIA